MRMTTRKNVKVMKVRKGMNELNTPKLPMSPPAYSSAHAFGRCMSVLQQGGDASATHAYKIRARTLSNVRVLLK